jgi:hypothetical protein
MMSRLSNILLALLVISLMSCIDDFDPVINSYQNLLVVDGGFSNEPGPHTVRLSLSTRVSDPGFIPVVNASVKITDNLDNIIFLDETEPGIYQTDEEVSGVIGRSYTLEVITASGKTYVSETEKLTQPVEIDTVYHETVTRQETGYDYDLYGYEFYVNTRQADNPESYLKWDLEATFQYQSEYTIRWYFDGALHWFHGPDSLYNCWKSHRINTIFTSSTNVLTNPVIDGFPLNFVSTETRELSVRYSLLVKQRTISETANAYWEETRKQNGGEWSLYVTQPHYIMGNITNINNPDEQVLGYFMVNGVDEMRIFVDRPPPEVPMRYLRCVLTEADFQAYGEMGMMDPVFYPLYAIETNGGRRATPHQDCVDCRRKGGTIEKPSFWIDE